jgi:hypothetical protein
MEIDLTDAETRKHLMRQMGHMGGKARLESMTKKARSESARNAAKARWKKSKKPTSR